MYIKYHLKLYTDKHLFPFQRQQLKIYIKKTCAINVLYEDIISNNKLYFLCHKLLLCVSSGDLLRNIVIYYVNIFIN